MLEIAKQYVVDEHQQTFAVQIPIETFNRIEEILENLGLSKLMEDSEDEEVVSGEEAYSFYQSLKGS